MLKPRTNSFLRFLKIIICFFPFRNTKKNQVMHYIVNEDIALQSLSLSRGYVGAIIVKNFKITQKKIGEGTIVI